METYLTKILKRKCKQESCEILYSEWIRERELAKRILQNVSNTAPNYSLHDSSHSNAILEHVVELVGKEAIENYFSATDIWMLLFVAYYHDIGMVVTYNDIRYIFKEEDEWVEFVHKIEKYQHDTSSGLHDASEDFEVNREKGYSKDPVHKIKVMFKDRYLKDNIFSHIIVFIADIFRCKHGERSKKFINDAFSQNNSLRQMGITSIIPQRLFSILADICASHTWEFNRVFEEIPFEELGMGGDEAHPRMIACLLRLGDVLDIDNNRFDPTSLAYVGEDNIPRDSKIHIRKHQSLTHFIVNRDRVEIRAKVDVKQGHSTNNDGDDNGEEFDEEAYSVVEETNKWFKWIRTEFSNQKQNIGSIYPKEYGIKLPEVDIRDCEIGGDYIFLNEKEKPKFVIDSKEAFELLRGMNLYEAPWMSIRELVQNAIDATLIKYWQDNKPNNGQDEEENFYKEFLKEIDNDDYGISLSVKKEKGYYHFILEDRGIGFTKDDLKYLLKVGSSKKNPNKAKLMDGMPEWLKPSGTFGIGFQSIFMITPYVDIATKSVSSGEIYSIRLYSPAGKHNGDVLIKKKGTDYTSKSYSKITFDVAKDTMEKLSLGGKNLQELTEYQDFDKSAIHDLFGKASDDTHINAILLELSQYLQQSPVPVKFNEKKLGKGEKYWKDVDKIELVGKDKMFSYQLDCQLYRDDISSYAGRVKIFYRNQYVCEYDDFALPFINIALNILSGSASEWLTLDRNRIREKQHDKLKHIIEQVVKKYITKMDKPADDEVASKWSLLYYVYLGRPSEQSATAWYDKKWEDYKIKSLQNQSLSELLSKIDIVEISDKSGAMPFKILKPDTNNKTKLQIYGAYDYDGLYNLRTMIAFVFRKYTGKVKIDFQEGHLLTLMYPKEKTSSETIKIGVKDDYKNIIRNIINQPHDRARCFIPLSEEYKDLSLDFKEGSAGEIERNISPLLPFDMDTICENITISPFIVGNENKQEKINGSENEGFEFLVTPALIKYVYDHRKNKKATEKQIKELYDKFVNHIK